MIFTPRRGDRSPVDNRPGPTITYSGEPDTDGGHIHSGERRVAAGLMVGDAPGDDRSDFRISSLRRVLTASGAHAGLRDAQEGCYTFNVYQVTTVDAGNGDYSATRQRDRQRDQRGRGWDLNAMSPPQPVVGSAVTATLTDEDGGITGETWRWASADTAGGAYDRIAGATSESYTPVRSGRDRRVLRATVRYSDGQGSGKMRDGGHSQRG